MGPRPEETPERALIRRAREALRLTVPEAAAAAGISHQNWARIEQGKAKTIPHGTLAHMAYAVGVTPEQLAEVERGEAAEILRVIERQKQPTPGEALLDRARRDPAVMETLSKLPPEVRQMAEQLAAELEERTHEAQQQADADFRRFVEGLGAAQGSRQQSA